MVDKYLGFVFQAAESGTVDDAIAVAFEGGAVVAELFGMLAAE